MKMRSLGIMIGFFLLLGTSVFAEELDSGILQFLLHQRHTETGILDSFMNSDDAALQSQASTYDLALAGLGFLQLKDKDSAKKILDFFERKWSRGGFCNFYNTRTGACGIEATVHLGPNMWVATLALQYAAQTGDRSFCPLAKKIALWGEGLSHHDGALAMGPVQDWGADWPNVFGAESNIVAYSVFQSLSRDEKDAASKVSWELEMQGIRDFLNKTILTRGSDGHLQNVLVGNSLPAAGLTVTACDVVAMLLLVFDPQELKTFFSLDEGELVDFARERFFVSDDGIRGFDFTDQPAALSIGRARMISLEWTMQMACALRQMSDFYNTAPDMLANRGKALRYREQASFFTQDVDKKAISFEGMHFYSYATKDSRQVFPFAPWWKTPQGDTTRCGAMASTMWRLFYDKNFNPLRHL